MTEEEKSINGSANTMGMITAITAHFQKIAATVWYATAENQ